MDQTIQLTIIKSLVMESVKNGTYKRGQFDKAIDEKAIAAAYHEQAGDEEYAVVPKGYNNRPGVLLFKPPFFVHDLDTIGEGNEFYEKRKNACQPGRHVALVLQREETPLFFVI